MRSLVVPLSLLLLVSALRAADEPASVYELIVQQYMTGKWEALDATIKTQAKEIGKFTPAQRQDLTYIKQSVLESRPAWWKPIKSGEKQDFRADVWGRAMNLTFDPKGKGVETKWEGNKIQVSVTWSAGDMDNPDHAEHGFSKAELNHLNVFATLGMAAAWTAIPPQTFSQISTEEQKALLWQSFDFHGNVTGVYYGTPRARQWGIWLYLHSYQEKYQQMSNINARKAVAVAFLMEVLANPKKYPSIKLPDKLDSDKAEEKLALAVHVPMEKQGWTLAEDKTIRQAIRNFTAANERVLQNGGAVTLPNGLGLLLDPKADEPLRVKRDAWFKKQFDKAKDAK